jgi:hypothetical protein
VFTALIPFRNLLEREKKRILAEILQVQGLMPLLMKPRNGQRWTREDKAQIRCHLRQLFELSPYLVALVLPAAPLTLPILAWWLDRRRASRDATRQSHLSAKSSETDLLAK